MNINTVQLQKKLCDLMCADIKLIERKNGNLLVKTPFYFPDGDPYLLYLKELTSGMVRLTDFGHTLMHLSYENDIDKFREGTRGVIFDQALANSGITENEGELFIDTNPDQLSRAIFRFGQAITNIYDITFLNRVRAESTFYGDLSEMLSLIVGKDKITQDFIYPEMQNSADYPIDYKIEGKIDPLYVFGVPSRDKAQLTTIILQQLLMAKATFESMIIFSDLGSIPKPHLVRLSNVGGEMIASLDARHDLERKIRRRMAI